jgi:hypothetical protein
VLHGFDEFAPDKTGVDWSAASFCGCNVIARSVCAFEFGPRQTDHATFKRTRAGGQVSRCGE